MAHTRQMGIIGMPLTLLLVLLANLQGFGPQGVLQALLARVHPLLDFRSRDIERSARLRRRGLALDDLQEQGGLALGRPALEFLFHRYAYVLLLQGLWPEQKFTRSLHHFTAEINS
jgi:hypothetical protein